MALHVRFIDVLALFVFARRTVAGLTQPQMAERLGVNERQVRAIENKRFVSKVALFRVAAALHLETQLVDCGGDPNAEMATVRDGTRDSALSGARAERPGD